MKIAESLLASIFVVILSTLGAQTSAETRTQHAKTDAPIQDESSAAPAQSDNRPFAADSAPISTIIQRGSSNKFARRQTTKTLETRREGSDQTKMVSPPGNLNLSSFGAYCDFIRSCTPGGLGCPYNSPRQDGALKGTTFTSASASFNSAMDPGKVIYVLGAGTGGALYIGMIQSVTNSNIVVVSPSAANAVIGQAWSYGHDDSAAVQACLTRGEQQGKACIAPGRGGWNSSNIALGAGCLIDPTQLGNPLTAVTSGTGQALCASGLIGESNLSTVFYCKPGITQQTTIIGGSISLPHNTIQVASTDGFADAGNIFVAVVHPGGDNVYEPVVCTGKTSTTFTGCRGGVGTATNGAMVRQGSCLQRNNANGITLRDFTVTAAIDDFSARTRPAIMLDLSWFAGSAPASVDAVSFLNITGSLLYAFDFDLIGASFRDVFTSGPPRWIDPNGPMAIDNLQAFGPSAAQLYGQNAHITHSYFQSGIETTDPAALGGGYSRDDMTIEGTQIGGESASGLTINVNMMGSRGLSNLALIGDFIAAGTNGIFGGAIGTIEVRNSNIQGNLGVNPGASCTASDAPIAGCTGLGAGTTGSPIFSPAAAQCAGKGFFTYLSDSGSSRAQAFAPCCQGKGIGPTCNGMSAPMTEPWPTSPRLAPSASFINDVLGNRRYLFDNFAPIELDNPGGANLVEYRVTRSAINSIYFPDYSNYPTSMEAHGTLSQLALYLRAPGSQGFCIDCKNVVEDHATPGAPCIESSKAHGTWAMKLNSGRFQCN